MKRHTYKEVERTNAGRSYLTEAGPWAVEEQAPDGSTSKNLGGGLSYLAASMWASQIEAAVQKFIDTNTSRCSSCGSKWIMLEGHDSKCPDCG